MATPNNRFLSLDVFRGLTVCFMIIVNTPGGGATPFAPLLHANWHGFTPTDLVFPSFLFVVGNAMSFAMPKYHALGERVALTKIFRRTALIFLLGYLMYWFPFFQLTPAGEVTSFPISETRIMGVLQRIAICYGVASLLIYFFSRRTVIALSVLFLVGYWVLLLVYGDADDPFSLSGNVILKLDRIFFAEPHLYHDQGILFEPESIFSTLPAIVNVVIGYYAGRFVQTGGKTYESVAKLLLTGALLIFVALFWNMIFPINKKLWTSTFVLLTTGLDLVIMGALIYVVEIRAWVRPDWTRFFLVFGKNPLFIYLLSEIVLVTLFMIHVTPNLNVVDWLNAVFFQPIAPGPVGSLLFAITYMLFCWSVGWVLDQRKIYVRV